jgi:hypothetical protein
MKAYVGVEAQLHTFLTSVLDRGDSSAPCPLYSQGKRSRYPMGTRLGGSQRRPGRCEERNVCWFSRESNQVSCCPAQKAGNCTNWAIPAPVSPPPTQYALSTKEDGPIDGLNCVEKRQIYLPLCAIQSQFPQYSRPWPSHCTDWATPHQVRQKCSSLFNPRLFL